MSGVDRLSDERWAELLETRALRPAAVAEIGRAHV